MPVSDTHLQLVKALLPLFKQYGANLDGADDDGNTSTLAVLGEHQETSDA